MDFDFNKRATEAGIDLSRHPAEVRASFMLNNIDDEAKQRSIETARADVQNYLGPAVPVFRYDKDGDPVEVAIGIVYPAIDKMGNYASVSKQVPIQYLTEWYDCKRGFGPVQWLELWMEAWSKCYLRRDFPVYDRIQGEQK